MSVAFTAGPALAATSGSVAASRRILAADDSVKRLGIVSPSGKLEWEIGIGSIHDAQVLPNGNILLQQGWNRIVEVDRHKGVVWEYDAGSLNGNAGKKVEVHSFQRLADGNTMIAECGTARIIEVDTEGKMLKEVKLKIDHPDSHIETRLVRKLESGNYLVAHCSDGCVREYNPTGAVVWEFDMPLFGKEPKDGHGPEGFGNMVFSAIRLKSGNTLVGGGNGHCVLEVNPAKEIVWKIDQNDLPGITLAWVTHVRRFPNGNTLFGNCHAGPDQPQMIEVTKDKHVVWTFKDFTSFGNSTPVGMVLD
ncbi:MAG: hypothetical protein V4689_09520 [Verrucomicrobiota bacterium]